MESFGHMPMHAWRFPPGQGVGVGGGGGGGGVQGQEALVARMYAKVAFRIFTSKTSLIDGKGPTSTSASFMACRTLLDKLVITQLSSNAV